MAPETSATSSQASVEGLNALAATAIKLLEQLEATLRQIHNTSTPNEKTPSEASESSNSTNILSLAHDSTSLIRAHATKISVFIINEPFTPSAISKVLRELVSSAVPGLVSSVQLCTAKQYTSTFRRDLAWKASIVFKELRLLIDKIPKDGKALPSPDKDGSNGAGGKGSLAVTGTLWAACDEVMRFSKAGVGGCFVAKVEEFRAVLKDVIEELKEWGEEEPDDDEDEDEDGDDDTAENSDDRDSGLGSMMPSTQEMVDDIMGSSRHIPRDDPNGIRGRLDLCLKRLRLTVLLYQAIVKRRMTVLPPLPTNDPSDIPQRLDEVMAVLKRLPSRFDELAGAFYELDAQEIDREMDQCFAEVVGASEIVTKPWEKEDDEFSAWAGKFQVQMKQTADESS